MKIVVEATEIPDLFVVCNEVFEDDRGFFLEVFRRDEFEKNGLPTSFVQLNHSRSSKNVLRGLHFQWDPPMGKLMRVTRGRAFLVAVDIRHDSPTLGQWFGLEVSAEEKKQVWAPAGFARGFCVLSGDAEIEYLCTGTYNRDGEAAVRWNDPEINVTWPVESPILSPKDETAPSLAAWLGRDEAKLLGVSS